MFDRIARVYDPMNLAISAFQEPRWRRRAVRADRAAPGDAGARRGVRDRQGGRRPPQARAQPDGRVLGVDISPGMIGIAIRRYGDRPGLEFVVGDALALPTEDASFDAATIAFGMRNLPDYRVDLRRWPGPCGQAAASCVSRSRGRAAGSPGSCVLVRPIVPLIGRVAGQGDAYGYLVRSVRNYPAPERIAEIMREAGLEDVSWRGLSGGIVTLHVGSVPRRSGRGSPR